MALFSSPPSPEIRQPQPLDLEAKRLAAHAAAFGILKLSVQAMDSRIAEISVASYNANVTPMYDVPATPTPEPGGVTALQEYYRKKAEIARQAHGEYARPAYEMSDDVARSMNDVYGKNPAPAENDVVALADRMHTTDPQSDEPQSSPTDSTGATIVPLTQRIAAANPDITMQSERSAA